MKFYSFVSLILTACVLSAQVHAKELPQPLVETSWLAENLDEVVVLDVRSNSKSYTAQPVLKAGKNGKKTISRVGGHIPGASLVTYGNVRTKRVINGLQVKNVIPEKAQFERLIQNAGINQNSKVVITTNAESGGDLNTAARMFWQLKYYGHDDVAILNGGTAQWLVEGREFATNAVQIEKGNWQANTQREELLATSEEVAEAIGTDTVQLVDVRPLGQYLGTNRGKGHISGAKNFPVEFMTSGRAPVKFLSRDELSELANAFSAKKKGDAIAYCNSGHMASGGWFVMHELLGNESVALFDGSMHQWNLEKRPTVRMIIE